MLPNMAPYLKRFEQQIIKRVKTITSVDFEETEVIKNTNIQAVVQVADAETIKVEQLDSSKENLMIHNSSDSLEIGQFVVWQGREYKIIKMSNYSDYGYKMPIAEEVK